MSPIADNVIVSNSSASSNPDYTVWTDELVDPVSGGTVQKQIVGIVDATAGGTTRAAVGANGLAVSATITGSIVPGTGATALGKAEDAAAASGDTGVAILAVRQDALANSVSADGDYGTLKINSSGALYTETTGTLTVSGTVPISVSSQYVEDAASAGGESLVIAGVVRQDSLASSTSADGDYAYLKVNAQGALYVTGGGGSGGTQYAEDSAHASGDLGYGALVVRKDTATQLAGTDGDYSLMINDASGRLHVNVGTSALPTGAATAAKQPALGTAGTASSDVITVQGIASMTPLSVTVSSALPAGTNAIGKLSANSGVDIGDVDVTSVTPGTAAASLGKAEDAVHASGDTGVMSLAVRNDAGTALAANGDYIPLMVNSAGALYVTGGGGGTQYVEDTASTGGETMTLAGVVRQDTLGSSTSADGDYAYLKTNNVGSLYTKDADLATSLARTYVVTDGSSKDHQGVLVEFTTAGVPTAVTSAAGLPVAVLGTAAVTGTFWQATQPVSLASVPSHAVTNAGTFAVQVSSALPAGSNSIGTVVTELATGTTPYSNTVLSNTKQQVKASAGKIHGWMVHNPSAATAYIQVFDVASGSITVGTTAPTWTIQLPAGGSANVFSEKGVTHATAINIAATTTPTGSTAPGTALVVSIFYV